MFIEDMSIYLYIFIGKQAIYLMCEPRMKDSPVCTKYKKNNNSVEHIFFVCVGWVSKMGVFQELTFGFTAHGKSQHYIPLFTCTGSSCVPSPYRLPDIRRPVRKSLRAFEDDAACCEYRTLFSPVTVKRGHLCVRKQVCVFTLV